MRRTGGHRSGQVGQTPSETENSGALLAFEWAQEAQGLHLAQEVFEIPNRGLQILVAALGATRGALFESPSNGNRHVRTVVGKAAEAIASKHVQVSGTSIVPAESRPVHSGHLRSAGVCRGLGGVPRKWCAVCHGVSPSLSVRPPVDDRCVFERRRHSLGAGTSRSLDPVRADSKLAREMVGEKPT